MDNRLIQISQIARQAVQRKNWPAVLEGAERFVALAPELPEGWFLRGLADKAAGKTTDSIQALRQSLSLDSARYDAAIELANQLLDTARIDEAIELLDRYETALGNSPRYLDMAGTIYTTLELPEKAWPLYQKANELQPDIELFQANLAACAVHLGKIDEAERIYQSLLDRHPDHQRNHYHLSRLRTATNSQHIQQMREVLKRSPSPPERNVFLYFALGKEYEDLEQWDNAFEFYKKGGDAISGATAYSVQTDIDIIDAVIETCTEDWLAQVAKPVEGPEPIFVLGLPRTGSTLTERIISNHSRVQSIGETRHLENILKQVSGVEGPDRMNPSMIKAAATTDMQDLAQRYLDAVRYQLGSEPNFLEKLPYNFLYAGFIARAFPQAKIVYVSRNPLDACFAMYKQVFTWAYQFSYNLENLGQYYIAHRRLLDHWQTHLQNRLITVEYEAMVQNQEKETRALLDKLGFEFEPQCLAFERNQSASTTASSVQVRQPIHTRSVEKWTYFQEQLEPLRSRLQDAGITC